MRVSLLCLCLVTMGCTAPEGTVVRFETELGHFDVAIAAEAAPVTATNFLKYVDEGFYNGGRFHRSVRLDNQRRSDVLIEVIQGGVSRDRRGNGYPSVSLERTRDTGLRHEAGTISMARGSPDSARSDIFICIGAQPSLDFGGTRNADGQGFAAFGTVVTGMNVIRKIHTSPTQGESLNPAIRIVSAHRLR